VGCATRTWPNTDYRRPSGQYCPAPSLVAYRDLHLAHITDALHTASVGSSRVVHQRYGRPTLPPTTVVYRPAPKRPHRSVVNIYLVRKKSTMSPDAADVHARRVIFVLILMAQFVGALGPFSLAALAPLVRAALHLSREQFGAVSAACLFGAVCACLPTGWLADRVGVRWLLIAGQGMSGVALVALLLRPTYGPLLLGMLCVGVTYGMTMVLTTKALADWFPQERRGTVIGAKFLAHSSAGNIAGLALPTVALGLGWRQAFAAVGGCYWPRPVWPCVAITIGARRVLPLCPRWRSRAGAYG
jgi:hypothetical protein